MSKVPTVITCKMDEWPAMKKWISGNRVEYFGSVVDPTTEVKVRMILVRASVSQC